MKAEELLKPRYEVVGDAPLLRNKIGEVITCDHPSGQIECDFVFQGKVHISPDSYPLIFKKLNWWEHRKKEDMPMKLISKAIPDDNEITEIVEWDMNIILG